MARVTIGQPMPDSLHAAPRHVSTSTPSPADVVIGLHVPHAFGARRLDADDVLRRLVQLDVHVSVVDAAFIEQTLGAPVEPDILNPPELDEEHGLIPLEQVVFDEALAVGRAAFAAQVRTWRVAADLTPLADLRRTWDDAGVRIATIHWPNLTALSDEEVEYAFRAATAVGAGAIATELSLGAPQRLAPVAERHGVTIAFHAHDDADPMDLEAALGYSPFIGADVDLGQWLVAGAGSPLAFLTTHADRIAMVRLTDRQTSDGALTWFGEGEAPIREVLQAMRTHAWSFPAIVEIGYDLASDADQMTEVARALALCRTGTAGAGSVAARGSS
jgi:sugar phosphate isomerase/epimerase